MATEQQLFEDIVHRHGGIDALSLTAVAIAKALAKALGTEPLDPNVIADLTALLPPPPLAPGAGHIDLSKLTDADLDALEAMHMKAGVSGPPPEPGSDRATINELLAMNEGLRAQCDRVEERAAIAEQSEQMYKRMHDEGVEACRDLRARLEAAEAAAWRTAHTEPQQAAPGQREPIREQPSNVVKLDPRGNGSASPHTVK
jgi:hypothetical protein